jgi:alkanesulfonate monooxygenase SsuD/methylene tetrahydromethanopterin reductase-like flavin-dependent oxidoreductase (luciferase family)
MVAISVAAAVTDTLRIGMLVLGNDYKHPAVVAKEAATLDVLSEVGSSSASAQAG